MAQQVINVGTAPNDGTGDPLRTAYIKTNDNFGELYNRVQTTPPASLTGSIGDTAGMYAYDQNYFYYCYANFDGTTQIWNQITNTGNVSVTSIASGNSSIGFNNINGNAAISVRGVSNVAVFSNTAVNIAGSVSATGNVAGGNLNTVSIYATGLVSAVGTVTGNYFVGNGAFLTGITTTYGNSNVATYLPTYTGGFANLLGNVTTTANVQGAYVLGNGSQLTGLPATYGNANVATYLAGSAGNIIPAANVSYSLGSSAYQWKDLWVSNSTIYINSVAVSINASNTLTVGGQAVLTNGGNTAISTTGNVSAANISATGNITGNYILGNGSLLTGIVTSSYGNSNVSVYLPTYTGSFASLTGNVTTTANISADNVLQNGVRTYKYSAGNTAPSNAVAGDNWWYTAGNILYQYINDGVSTQWVDVFDPSFPPSSTSSAANTIAQRDSNSSLTANVFIGTTASVTGNITGSYILGNGSQLTGITASLSGNIFSANVLYTAPYANTTTRTQSNKNTDIVSVKDFGAVGNGSTNDGPAFQQAVNALGNNGGTIMIPPGTYLINTQVVISNYYGAVTFEGYGWGDFYGPYANPSPAASAGGSRLKTTNSSASPFSITAGANGTRFRYLSCLESHPTPGSGWAPTAYQPFFNVQADGFELDHVFFFGINKGVVVGQTGVAVGRASFTHVWGEFFNYGINIAYAADVCRIDHMHVWPFWSQATNNDVLVYTTTNTKAIATYRCDNPQFSNIFTYACHNAIYIGSSADGTTSKMIVTNIDADATDTGIQIDANYVTLAVNNYSSQPGPNALVSNTSRSLFIQASSCSVQITNFRSARTNVESVYVGGTYNNVGIVNYDVNHWASAGGSNGAIASADATNTITLAGRIVFGVTDFGTQFGGTLGSINWPNATKGTNTGNTNGSGNVVITHGLTQSPNEVYCQIRQPSSYILAVTNISATTFTVTVLNSTTGGSVNNTQVLFAWQTDM